LLQTDYGNYFQAITNMSFDIATSVMGQEQQQLPSTSAASSQAKSNKKNK